MLVELAELTQTVADLEEQQEDVRHKLVKAKALHAELLSAADELNRRRRDRTAGHSSGMHPPLGSF